MGRADIGRSDACPFRIEPEAGQVSKNGSKCPQSMLLTVVSQTPRAGFHVANNALNQLTSAIGARGPFAFKR